jgi:hypothetical protein
MRERLTQEAKTNETDRLTGCHGGNRGARDYGCTTPPTPGAPVRARRRLSS